MITKKLKRECPETSENTKMRAELNENLKSTRAKPKGGPLPWSRFLHETQETQT